MRTGDPASAHDACEHARYPVRCDKTSPPRRPRTCQTKAPKAREREDKAMSSRRKLGGTLEADRRCDCTHKRKSNCRSPTVARLARAQGQGTQHAKVTGHLGPVCVCVYVPGQSKLRRRLGLSHNEPQYPQVAPTTPARLAAARPAGAPARGLVPGRCAALSSSPPNNQRRRPAGTAPPVRHRRQAKARAEQTWR